MKKSPCYLAKASLCAATVLFAGFAQADQITTAPALAGGVTASIGTMFVAPSVANDDYATSIINLDGNDTTSSILNVEPDYEWGLLASLGYVFENTANGVELNYRGLFDASSSASASVADFGGPGNDQIAPKLLLDTVFESAKSSLEIEHHALDLMFSQFMNLGQAVQMRFSAGISYVDFEQKQTSDFSRSTDDMTQNEVAKTDFSGFGPRMAIDARYDFGQGFGIVAGGSAAYLVGDLDTSLKATLADDGEVIDTATVSNNKSDHAVTNLRGNIGLDYVYFLDNQGQSTIGLEVGYMADWYDNMTGDINGLTPGIVEYETDSVTFTGPYLLVKGAF